MEAACYEELSVLVREVAAIDGHSAARASRGESRPHRLSLQHLLAAAGSSPAASAAGIARMAARFPEDARWASLLARTRAITAGAKEAALLQLLAQHGFKGLLTCVAFLRIVLCVSHWYPPGENLELISPF